MGDKMRKTIKAISLVATISAIAGSLAIIFGVLPLSGSSQHPVELTSGSATEKPRRVVVDLPPIVTNLSEPADIWIRVEAAAIMDPMRIKNSNVVIAAVADDVLAYLRTLTLAQIGGAAGFASLRNEITARAIVRGGDGMLGLVLKTLVVQ